MATQTEMQEAIATLTASRPDLVPALKSITALAKGDAQARHHANVLLTNILEMQIALGKKIVTAKKMLVLRTGLCTDPNTGHSKHHSLRHIPNVMIRLLCDIAEVPMYTSATIEWLDKMQAREEARPIPGGYEEQQ